MRRAAWLGAHCGDPDLHIKCPGTTPSQPTQALVFSLVGAFVVLYVWRILFQAALGKLQLEQRVGHGRGLALRRAVLQRL